jgi:ABC-type bacteriocin/lantibiotic exporter with double-glycine peptidase domain
MTDNLDSHPTETASRIAKIMVSWVNPLIETANTRQLNEKDVPNTPKKQSVVKNLEIVRDSWYEEKVQAVIEQREASLSTALARGFKNNLVRAGIYQTVFMVSQLAQPFLVGELVNFVATGDGGASVGLGLAFGLACISGISSFSITMAFLTLRNLGISIRSGMMMLIYEHALKLTSNSKQKNTVGQMTNLMAIDAEKLFLAAQFLHFLW